MSQVVTLEDSEPQPQTGSSLEEGDVIAFSEVHVVRDAEGLRTTSFIRNAGEFAGNLV